ncbi:hypothetical protein VOLCADRAFT_120065 [Volvox carteri f. nagariensis]|uniref:UBC core domain-containing protein n=1 Tax=Volvox carteri f. nagariensis TaxID=3068 RepID=D8UJQ1_VOLCA|nr:uncharacterized protein VOLCADRAFT_120065 [Volvox carteri f. nagariensis]EFJ40076.1 hypothetical protein VOLCADRAFT_120065 [Volvox carteri f. nagariensis]|eukprot:XP_002958888.1 hypothetical protein VOLCADRAFT_120065 [Volvox carteri f. nagariensis]
MADAPKFNLRNPAVKRIMQEIKEIKQDTTGDFLAEALETDIFEWHFVIRGPPDTEFEGGIYHGRILLPAEYPFKPPSFMMLTPNGRFETNMKICLSISSHHPEHWQPSWSVRTALTALIAFMPSPGAGALGALDFPKDERRALAARSRVEPPRFGSADRQRLIEEMHNRMDRNPGRAALGSSGSAPTAAAAAATAMAAAAAAASASERQDSGVARSSTAAMAPVAAATVVPNAAAAAAAAAATSTDHMLTALMWALYFGIGAILLRKVMGVIGFDLNELMQ